MIFFSDYLNNSGQSNTFRKGAYRRLSEKAAYKIYIMINTTAIAGKEALTYTIPAQQSAGTSFSEYLNAAKEEMLLPPEKWCEETDKFGRGVDKAVRYMQEQLGIDLDSRTPTHEITAEQMQWLKSRHNLDEIYKSQSGTCDCGESSWHMGWYDENFLSDLVYLNVMSADEVKKIGRVTVPESSFGGLIPASGEEKRFSTANILGALAAVVGKQKENIDFVKGRYSNPLLISEKDKEYLENAEEYLGVNQIFFELLSMML